jgi:hypothetical protein
MWRPHESQLRNHPVAQFAPQWRANLGSDADRCAIFKIFRRHDVEEACCHTLPSLASAITDLARIHNNSPRFVSNFFHEAQRRGYRSKIATVDKTCDATVLSRTDSGTARGRLTQVNPPPRGLRYLTNAANRP